MLDAPELKKFYARLRFEKVASWVLEKQASAGTQIKPYTLQESGK